MRGAFCPYCMAMHITGLLLAGLVIWRTHRQFDDNSTDTAFTGSASTSLVRSARLVKDVRPSASPCIIGPLPAIALVLCGLGLAGILAACQVAFASTVACRSGESQRNPPAIDPHDVPLIGSPDAPYVKPLRPPHLCNAPA